MTKVRAPAVAGVFYPDEPEELRAAVQRFIKEGAPSPGMAPPVALIVPHAGYIYSGPVAGSAYALLEPIRSTIRRVVLIGPSHFARFSGVALPEAEAMATPLGQIPVDLETAASLRGRLPVILSDAAHGREHSLEVQLPFLQQALDEFSVLPLATGMVAPGDVAVLLEEVWHGDETLVVVSSDLSHYLDYESARRLDARTAEAVQALQPEAMDWESACGLTGVQALLTAARRRGLTVTILDLRNSGDTAGSRGEVVGYGAFAFCPPG